MTFGVCAGCGAVAWELLSGQSDYCMGCDSAAYNDPRGDDECSRCDCEGDERCWPASPSGSAAEERDA